MSKLTYAVIFILLCAFTISIARDYLCDDLRNPDNQYDYIVISGNQDAVYPRVKPLMDWRYDEGFSPLFTDIHDIYAEFGSSGDYMYAMKVFINWARANWTVAPEYIFLIGHGWDDDEHTYDDFFVPVHIDLSYEWNGYKPTLDTWFVEDASGKPTLQIGRLNVKEDSPTNVDNYCEKVRDYESTLYEEYSYSNMIVTWDKTVDSQNYQCGISISRFLDDLSVNSEVYLSREYPDHNRWIFWINDIKVAIENRQSLLVYFVHGKTPPGMGGLPGVNYQPDNDRYFILLGSACTTTNFQFSNRNSRAGDCAYYLGVDSWGAVGFLSPPAINNYTSYSRRLFEELLTNLYTRSDFSQRNPRNRLGDLFVDVLLDASDYRYNDYRTYNISGDPALLVNIPVMPSDGYITEDTVWSGSVSLTHDVLIPRGRTLTLSPGTTLEAAQVDAYEYGYLDGQVSDAKVELIVEGELVIEGTEDNPVVLSGDEVNGWGGILVRNAGEVSGSNLLITNAEWGIHLQDGGEAHLTESLIYDCDRGVFAHGRRVSFSGLNIENCGIGVFVDNGEDLEGNELYKTQVKMRDCYLTNNQRGIRIWHGLSFDAGTVEEPGNNVISANRVMDIDVSYSSGLAEASFTGNAWGTFYASRIDEIFAQGHIPEVLHFPFQVAGVLGEDETVPPPPIMGGSVALDGDLTIPDGLTLTIPAGCTLEAANTDIAHSGSDSHKAEIVVESGGSLVSEGTVQNPILLTSSNDNPGSWYGVRFAEGSSGSLQHTVIEKAIYGVESSSSPQLDHVELRECSLAGYRSLGGSGELTDCYIHDNDSPTSVIEGDDYGHGVVATGGSVVRLRNCEISDNAGDGVRVLGGSPDLGSYDSLGRNQFDDNDGLDISYESGVVPGGGLAAGGNEFGTIDGIELDRRVSDSVALSPVVFGGTVNHGSDLPYFEPDEEQLPVCYVDRDVYLVDDFVAEPAAISIEPDDEDLVYFELRFAHGTKIGLAPNQESASVTPGDPLLVDVLIDVPCFFEVPEGSVPGFGLEPSGGFIPSPWETNESIPPMEFHWGELTFGEHCLELDWHEALIDGATSVTMDSGQFDETNPALFERVFIRDIAAAGFELLDGGISFRSCQLIDNLDNGLQLNSDTWAKLYRCEVSGNDGDGIYLDSGAEIDLGAPVGGDEPLVGLNYFADNTGFDLNNNSGSPVAAHGNQWSESDWDTLLDDAIHNPGGENYQHLYPLAWSGVLKSGENPNKCNWLGNMLLLGDVTVPVGMLAGQPFQLIFELPMGAQNIEIAELPGLDRTHGGEDSNKSEFRINGEVISEAPIHLTRLSLPTVMDGEFPPPEIGEWTGLIHSSADMDTLDNYEVRWAETGIRVINGGLTALSNCKVIDSNAAVALEGVSPTLFGNELHAEIEGLVCSDSAWPVLVEEPAMNSFYMDFNFGTLPSHFYIANRNSSITPDDPTSIDATLCKWYNSDGENQQPEDWMFDGDVTYESTTMLAENSSQIITEEEDDKAELEAGQNETDLANDDLAIELGNSDVRDDISTGNTSLVDGEPDRLESDESSALSNDSLETAALEVEYLSNSAEDTPQLLSVVPNPTNGMITITVDLNSSQRVELALYDLAGRLVETIHHHGSLSEGRHSISYDTAGIIGGLYLLHLTTDVASETTRLAIVR